MNRRSHDLELYGISSDSDDALDEIVITASSFDFKGCDFLNPLSASPIHFCDNSTHSDDNYSNTATISLAQVSPNDDQEMSTTNFSNQLTTDSCTSKNSKSRRMEYSMRGLKMCSGSNPSQDSAFGSMTDGELSIASSSLRMSSFQSMSSPIDEGVEDSITGMPGPSLSRTSTQNTESDASAECSIAQSASDMSLSKKKSSIAMPMEPPTILVNDKNSSFYITSPAKAFGTTEVFSQKYRVSSFEDMTNKRAFLKNVHKQNFRSLEEEQRIDSAFMPIGNYIQSHHRSFDLNRTCINNPEKFKKLTHVAFARKISTTKERHTMWKNSILARKNNLIKSNESLHDYGTRFNQPLAMHPKLHKRVNSTNELNSTTKFMDAEKYAPQMGEGLRGFHHRKSRSERQLLNLAKLKQSTIGDYEEGDEDEENAIHISEIESFIDETSSSSSCTNNKTDADSSDSSPSHRSMCKIIGGIDTDTKCIEEKVPLLDGMEMSPMSPVETDEML